MPKKKILPIDRFFRSFRLNDPAITYSEVRLKSGRKTAEVMPDKVSVESRFSRNISLKIPVVSAAMDTVTGFPMAIAMAELGGIGVVHKNQPPEPQAKEINKVKKRIAAIQDEPICFNGDEIIANILAICDTHGYKFDHFPVIDNERKSLGILTGEDFRFCTNTSLPARAIMTSLVICAPLGTTVMDAFKLMQRNKQRILPLVDKEGCVVAIYAWKDVKRSVCESGSMYNLDHRGQLRVAAAIGVGTDALRRVELLVAKNVDAVVIDTAHADSRPVFDTLREVKRAYPSLEVIVGNVSEPESVERLCRHDPAPDAIRIGQGPGSICTTRVVAGIGCPQATAVYECVRVASKYGVPINADGGLEYSGDLPIALALGATSVTVGNILAGTDEAPGEVISYQGRRWKYYRGMGSMGALLDNLGSREHYLQSEAEKGKLIPEGIEGYVPYRGPVADVLLQLVGGLRQGMGYVGAASVKELQQLADFRLHSDAAHREGHPHDILMIKDAPNYSRGDR